MRLKDKVAIVTGAARGIGRAIALGYAREGASVVINDFRSAEQAVELAREIESFGGRAATVDADVSDLSSHERIVAAAIDRFGRLDILVNNAGVEYRAPFLEATPENFDRTLAVNLRAPYFLSQLAAKRMAERGGGRIILIESTHNTVPLRNASTYNVSKGGLQMLMKSLALELARHRINVNGLAPGAILTDINREVLQDPAHRDRVLAKIPLGRIGDPRDIVGAAIFLASSDSDYVTGATLYVDGGLLLQ